MNETAEVTQIVFDKADNPSNAEASSSKAQERKDFWKPSKPCHVGAH